MTDPTTTPTPPQGLTDAQLLELADGEIEADDVLPMDEYEAANDRALEVYRSELLAFGRAAIAAHEAARVGLHCYLDDDGPCPSPCVFDDPAERISDCTYAQGLQRDGKPKTACPHYRAAIAADRANHLRDATKMALTPEEVEARFLAWWAESYPAAPVGTHAVQSHVAFALHLMGGEVAA